MRGSPHQTSWLENKETYGKQLNISNKLQGTLVVVAAAAAVVQTTTGQCVMITSGFRYL